MKPRFGFLLAAILGASPALGAQTFTTRSASGGALGEQSDQSSGEFFAAVGRQSHSDDEPGLGSAGEFEKSHHPASDLFQFGPAVRRDELEYDHPDVERQHDSSDAELKHDSLEVEHEQEASEAEHEQEASDVEHEREAEEPETGDTEEPVTTTPEPSSMALLGTGLVGLVPLIRRRRK